MAPDRLPSFFKILLHPASPHLPLPPAFVCKHLNNKIPDNPILQSVNGGYSWSLKIRRTGESYCFADGWNNVVEDSHLGFGDLLVFWLVDHSTFKLSVFSPNGCEKHFSSKIHVEDDEEEDDGGGGGEVADDDDDDDGGGGGDIDGNDRDPFFTKIISKNKSIMRLPLKFVRLAGIDVERIIAMKNLDGKEWQMRLRLENCTLYSRYFLSAGWSNFRRVNELSEGDECVFKFIRSEDKLYLVKVTKKTIPANQSAGKIPATKVLKRKRGAPQRLAVVPKKLQ